MSRLNCQIRRYSHTRIVVLPFCRLIILLGFQLHSTLKNSGRPIIHVSLGNNTLVTSVRRLPHSPHSFTLQYNTWYSEPQFPVINYVLSRCLHLLCQPGQTLMTSRLQLRSGLPGLDQTRSCQTSLALTRDHNSRFCCLNPTQITVKTGLSGLDHFVFELDFLHVKVLYFSGQQFLVHRH